MTADSSKECTKCNVTKDLTEYYLGGVDRTRVNSWCKACVKERRKLRYAINPDRTKQREWAANNRDKMNRYTAEYLLRNPKRVVEKRENWREWRKQNIHVMRAHANKRRAAKINATPTWLTDEHYKAIQVEYQLAAWTEQVTGMKMHVDHIIPLQGWDVCGLHVPWNLQVIPAFTNLSKGNKNV